MPFRPSFTPARTTRRLLPALAAVAVTVVGCVDTDRAREPVTFAPVAFAAFDDPGSLTDAWADVDGDGYPDRFVGFNGAPARMYRNLGASRFEDVAPQLGLDMARRIRTAAWGDADGDGDPDLFLGFAGDGPVTGLFRNDGADGFTDVTEASGLSLAAGATRQAVWVDVDGDDDLDLFLALRDAPNRMWRNDGGTFTDVTDAWGLGDARRSVGAVWFDADSDGDLDVYVANMDGDANGMWRNDGSVFTDVAAAWGLDAGGRALDDPSAGTVRPCAVDADHDGDIDLFTANYGPNGLFLNPGPGSESVWRDAARELGLATDSRYDACAWGDFDHDGRLDLFVNGTVTGGTQYRDWLFRRQGGEAFVDVTPEAILSRATDHGVTWVDHDRDGDLDLALTGVADDGSHPVLQNLLRPEFAGHSLFVRVLDADGRATRAGAEVHVYGAGPDGRLLSVGLVDAGSGYDAQSDLPVHMGLSALQPVRVRVVWPDGRTRQTTEMDSVDPAAYRGRVLEVRIPAR